MEGSQLLTQSVEPIFFKYQDFVRTREENATANLTTFDVCEVIRLAIGAGEVKGAQSPTSPTGGWQVYMKTTEVRMDLITRRDLKIFGNPVQLYDKNPFVTKVKSEKITIKHIPLSVSNHEIYLDGIGAKCTTELKYVKARNPQGELTECLNGDRSCYTKNPVEPRLPRSVVIVSLWGKLFHDSPPKTVKLVMTLATKQEMIYVLHCAWKTTWLPSMDIRWFCPISILSTSIFLDRSFEMLSKRFSGKKLLSSTDLIWLRKW